MIPKTIHYCWFGRGEKPELAIKCIESWKKYCPDYTLVEWNEDNFDVSSNLYVKQAYEAKKYAFVSDYVRLYALYHQGGVYMDTDVMLLKGLDDYLHHAAFCGFEDRKSVSTGLMASQKEHGLMKEFLDYYGRTEFLHPDGTYDLTTNVKTITDILLGKGLCPNGHLQTVEGYTIYPQNIFSPEHSRLDDGAYMADTVAIHYFAGSWKSARTLKREKSLWWRVAAVPAVAVSKVMRKLFGKRWETAKNKVRDRILRNE